MLTAYGRVVRAQRRLARLAPSFFDEAVMARERENHAEQRRWMALWEPAIAKVYGVDHKPVVDHFPRPPLPPPRIQRAVDRQLAELSFWLAASHAAAERQRQRRPHALPTFTQLARLLEVAFDLQKMVLGLDSKNQLPEKITYDYEFTDLKRAYGHLLDPTPPAAASDNAIAGSAAPSTPLSSTAPPVQNDSPVVPVSPPADPPQPAHYRCDAWSRYARQMQLRSAWSHELKTKKPQTQQVWLASQKSHN
jgi:hypothetical protein